MPGLVHIPGSPHRAQIGVSESESNRICSVTVHVGRYLISRLFLQIQKDQKALQHPAATHVLLMLWFDLRLCTGTVGQSPRSVGRFHCVCWSSWLWQNHNSPRRGSEHVQGAAGVLTAFGVSFKLTIVVGKILNE